jgi:hypothetical protein
MAEFLSAAITDDDRVGLRRIARSGAVKPLLVPRAGLEPA